MLNEETKVRIAKLAAEQAKYRPHAATRAKLAEKTLVMLVSATCMGKSTIMRELADEIPTVGTITTRPARQDDAHDRYEYFEHSDTGLAPLLHDIETGKLVQYTVNPHSGFIYGSRVEDYPGEINIGDYFSTVVDDFKDYGFKRTIPISVITDPASWLRRFEARFPAGYPDRQARLREAVESLEWSLSRADTQWVINHNGASQVAAASVKTIIQGETAQNQAEAKELALQCIRQIKELL